jgi:hypothetical protein
VKRKVNPVIAGGLIGGGMVFGTLVYALLRGTYDWYVEDVQSKRTKKH